MKVAFVGGGNMATALIGGLLKKGWRPDDIYVAEIDEAARGRIEQETRTNVYADIAPAVEHVESIVLAVKPQHVLGVAEALRPRLAQQLVISIAAGIRLSDLSRWLGGYSRLVRAMPNTPALSLAGMTGLYARDTVASEDRGR